MSVQTGRRGMGSHKHGVSGRAPHNKTNALARSREFNAELKKKAELKQRHKGKMFGSVKDVFK